MKRLWIYLITFLLIGGIAAVLMSHRQQQAQQLREAQRPLPVTVETAPVTYQTFIDTARYVGRTEAWREVAVNATAGGTVRQCYVALNNSVRAGQPLLRVDAELAEIAVQQAEAQLTKSRADLARYVALQREGNGMATEVETAKLQAETAEANLRTARKQQRDAQLLAPIGGTITEKTVERGLFVQPGQALLTITDVSSVKLVVPVPEADLAYFHACRAVAVTFDAYPGATFRGVVHYVRLKGTDAGHFPVEIRVENSAKTPLRVGLTGRVALPGRDRSGMAQTALSVPRQALLPTAQAPTVFVLTDGKLQRRTLETAPVEGQTLRVLRGLRAGERVVVSNTEELKEGQNVKSERAKERLRQ